MTAADLPACRALLAQRLERFSLAPTFSEAEFGHWFLPRAGVLYAYVVQNPADGKITDMASFYALPSTVIAHPVHKTINAAYLFYCANTSIPLKTLMNDLLIMAAKVGAPRRTDQHGTLARRRAVQPA